LLAAECDPAALNLTNGDLQADRYYGGDNLLYSCDDGYTETTDPVCNAQYLKLSCKLLHFTEPFKLETYHIALIAGGGALVVVIMVVVLLARCLRHRLVLRLSHNASYCYTYYCIAVCYIIVNRFK